MLSSGYYPKELRKEGVDEGVKLTYLTRDINPFNYMIHKNSPFNSTKATVKDRIFRTREITELDRFFTVTVPSSTSTAGVADAFHRKFGVSNNQAAQLREDMIIYIMGLYVNVISQNMIYGQVIPQTATGLSTGTGNVGPDLNIPAGYNPTSLIFSRQRGVDNSGNVFVDYEQCKIVEVGGADSAGTGNTTITVERCYFGPGEGDMGGMLINRTLVYGTAGITGTTNGGINDTTNGANAVIGLGDIIFRGMPVAIEGTNFPTGVYKNPTEDINYTQEYKYALERTAESEIVDKALFINETAMDINRWITLRQANRDREYGNLMNKKMRNAVQGREEYVTGGVIPWIYKDAAHYIILNNMTLTWQNLLWVGRNIFYLGGGSTRTCFIGITLDAALRAAYWQSGFLQYSKEESNAFNMEVNKLVLSGGSLNLVVSQVMEENGWGSSMLCLDMTNKDAFEPVTNPGWDYKVMKDIQEKGSMIYKEGVVGMFGLRRRYRPFHCVVDFSIPLSNSVPQGSGVFTGVQPSLTGNQP